MQLTIYQRQVLRQGIIIVLVGTAAGLLYVLISGQSSTGHVVVNGFVIGFTISLVLAVFELWFFSWTGETNPLHLPFCIAVTFLPDRCIYYCIQCFCDFTDEEV